MSFRGDEGKYLGIEGVDDGLMYDFFSDIAQEVGGVVATHPENIEIVWRLRSRLVEEGREDLKAWMESRPDFVEAENVARALQVARQTGVTLYIPHLSCALGLEEVRRFRDLYDGYFVETCPHYLTHTSNGGTDTLAKVNPPLRTDEDRAALWEGLADGSIQVVGSDHVPRRSSHKEGGIWKASAGFPGLATLLPVLLSEGHHRRGLPLHRIAELTSENPARIYGLYPEKGTIRVGSDADLTLVDLDLERRGQGRRPRLVLRLLPLRGVGSQGVARGDDIARQGGLRRRQAGGGARLGPLSAQNQSGSVDDGEAHLGLLHNRSPTAGSTRRPGSAAAPASGADRPSSS